MWFESFDSLRPSPRLFCSGGLTDDELDLGFLAERLPFPAATNGPAVLSNIAYFGGPRNSGFKMMPNEIETWEVGDRAFEFSGTTGFMTTIDMSPEDVAD